MCNAVTKAQVAIAELIQRYRYNAEAVPPTDYEPLLRGNSLLERIFVLSDCAVAISEISTAGFLYISDKLEQLLGYKAEAYKQGGLAFALSLVHPDDILGIVFMLQKELDYLFSIPVAERLAYRSSFDYRCQRADGSYIRLLQRNQTLDLDKTGNMLHRLLMVNDITHLKKDDHKMVNIVQYNSSSFTYTYHVLNKAIHKENFLSKRELEILQLLRQGLGSKEIADNLFISVHTVETHRRNILEKTNIKDTSCLISFALTAGFIN